MDWWQAEKLVEPVGRCENLYSTPSAEQHPPRHKKKTNGKKPSFPTSREMNGEDLVVAGDEEKRKDSSSSGSSDSATSSSGEETSSSSSAESTSQPSTLWIEDDVGEYIVVTCAGNEAKFYKDRFARGSIGRCVWFKGRWITPNEFQAVSGRQSSKDWKRSIRSNGRCLKEYISEGLFREHVKTCSCKICQGEDEDMKRQEGVMALAAKRRRLSQAGADGSHGSCPPPSHNALQQPSSEAEGLAMGEESGESGNSEEDLGQKKIIGSGVKRKRGRSTKSQRVWSPSGEVAQDVSSNEDEYLPNKLAPNPIPDSSESTVTTVIDASDFLPRRSRRGMHRKQTGYRTELGTYTRKPVDWDAEEVAEFMRLQGFADYADSFQDYDIDGQSLFLLREHHLLERFSMKLGPTLRLMDTISRLRHPPVM